jgi:hypothetical protein
VFIVVGLVLPEYVPKRQSFSSGMEFFLKS